MLQCTDKLYSWLSEQVAFCFLKVQVDHHELLEESIIKNVTPLQEVAQRSTVFKTTVNEGEEEEEEGEEILEGDVHQQVFC